MDGCARRVLALSGGVGGARLAQGLAAELPAGALHVLVNTADDFEHLGLHISPDIDTLLYTLSGRAHPAQGWGLRDESFHMLETLAELGGETWFQLGDRDLALHLRRSTALAAGATLSGITADLARRLGLATHVHPMSDDRVRTRVHCAAGDLPFQTYFVRERCAPVVREVSFAGIAAARPNDAVVQLLADDAFDLVVVCPSNPFLSIDPILQLPGLAQRLCHVSAPVLLVSPIVAGAALKGPAAKMMQELGLPATATGVAEHYAARYPGLVDVFVIDSDATLAPAIATLARRVEVTATVMKTLDDKRRLARFALARGRA